MRRLQSLRIRLGLGAAVMALAALLNAVILGSGMERISARLDESLAAERRLDVYSALSTQVSTFIVVAAETVQTGLPPDARAERLGGITDTIRRTFRRLRSDLEASVAEAGTRGVDEQTRRATQSIGIARMEALFNAVDAGFASPETDRERLQGHLDNFANGFDPLLGDVVRTEVMLKDQILAGIDALRLRLTTLALLVSAATIAAFAGFHYGLVRPQFHRLDQLRGAAQRIGKEDFAVHLPVDSRDEIGALFSETNRMADALADRQKSVRAEWARLNETIEARTEELRAANARLAKTDEDRRRFFADISHELRTPLTVILMEAQLGRAGAAEPLDAFGTIEARAERLNRRIDDLLRIARSESGQLALGAAPFDLGEAAREALAETRAELEAAGMAATEDLGAPAPVTGDRNWIRQVVAGLIRNAIRHARAGRAVHVALTLDAAEARISVTDDGPGIEPADRAGLLERFGQGRSAAPGEGFGLGLALARWVVEAQGGRISVDSPVPRDEALGYAPGTKVTVGLPRDAA